ncbi:MAG: hypothetical protein IPL12_07255 [Bacteroidetes bacterium]|nr:hypothetical protein [Bacteroidota bacterium]
MHLSIKTFVNYISDTTYNISWNLDTVRINGNLQYYSARNLREKAQYNNNTTSSVVNYPMGNEPVRLITKYMLKYNGRSFICHIILMDYGN